MICVIVSGGYFLLIINLYDSPLFIYYSQSYKFKKKKIETWCENSCVCNIVSNLLL